MDAYQQDLRRAADQAFIESLNLLEEMLLDDRAASGVDSPLEDSCTSPPIPEESHLDLAALEEAVADIEAFMQQRSS